LVKFGPVVLEKKSFIEDYEQTEGRLVSSDYHNILQVFGLGELICPKQQDLHHHGH